MYHIIEIWKGEPYVYVNVPIRLVWDSVEYLTFHSARMLDAVYVQEVEA